VADQIRGDHRVALGEPWHHQPPGVRGRRDPVQQDQQRPLPHHPVTDGVAVQLDLAVRRQLDRPRDRNLIEGCFARGHA
jgi:hypothetical protein